MNCPDWLKITAGEPRRRLPDGTQLRLLTARQVLEARREAAALAGEEAELPLCSNACLVARALLRRGRPVYASGRRVLEALTPKQIQALARSWAAFDREENPGPSLSARRGEALKKVWSTCRRSAFNGMCSGPSGRSPRKNGPKG